MSEAPQDPHPPIDGLADATRRLERALLQLEAKLKSDRRPGDQDLFARDRLAVAAELDATRRRNHELESAAAAAAAALGRAADEVRATLAQDLEYEALEDEGSEALDPEDEDPGADDPGADAAAAENPPPVEASAGATLETPPREHADKKDPS